MSDNIQTNTTGRLTPCLQQKIDKPRYFVALLLSCELWTYLADLNEQAEKRLDIIMEQMKIVEGVTDELKAQNHWESRPPAKPNIINLRISAAHLNHFIKCLFIAEHVKRKNAHILPLKGVWAF